MINPNELRLGNYVNAETSSHENMYIRVIGITSAYIKGVSSNFGLSVPDLIINDVKPVPLTEKILLKCGFEETQLFEDDPTFLFLNGFGLRIDYFEDAFYFDDAKIGYVHQLMNLYFAITGKELEVKL